MNQENSKKWVLEGSPVSMISQSGKKTIFLFQTAQRRPHKPSGPDENSTVLHEKTTDIHRFVQNRLDRIQSSRKTPKTYAFNAVSRSKLETRVKSDSPKSNGDFYQIHYELIEKKSPFLTKIPAKRSMNKPLKTPFQESKRAQSSDSLEGARNPLEAINHSARFACQLERPELFSWIFKNRTNSPLTSSQLAVKKVSSPNFALYTKRKPFFPTRIATQKDYDRSPEIKERLTCRAEPGKCLVDIAKSKKRDYFNDLPVLTFAETDAPNLLAMTQAYCKTHRVFNVNAGCWSPKVGRERPSPIQDRILRMNEKLGFACFQEDSEESGKNEGKASPKRQRPKGERFELKRLIREVEREVRDDIKRQKYGRKKKT